MEDSKKKKVEAKLVEKKSKISKSAEKKIVKNSSNKEAPKKRPRREKPIMDRPKYLNLKVLHDFDKVKEKDLFLDGRLPKPLTLQQRRMAKAEFTAIGEKYKRLIQELIDEHNGELKHLVIAGGNYTFFFILPIIMRWIQENFPHIGVEFKLFEGSDLESLKKLKAHIVLTAEYSQFAGFTQEELDAAGYVRLRQNYVDSMYFAASPEAIARFGSKEAVLKHHNLMFSRLYRKYGAVNIDADRLSLVTPKDRKDYPRFVMDQFFLENLMGQNGVGITVVYSSMPDNPNLIRLHDEPIEKIERYVIVKKSLHKKYHAVARRLIYILQHRGK